jgi:Fe-S cluster biogenesis protein NfuA
VNSTIDSSEFQKRAEKVEQIIAKADAISDESMRATVLELLQSLMDLHGAGVSRMVELLGDSEAGRSQLAKLGKDPLICGLLVLYGVHPATLEERVKGAIETVNPQLRKHGAMVELGSVTEAVVQLKIGASGYSYGSSPEAIKRMLEQAVRGAAPEVVEVAVEGLASTASGFVPLDRIQPAKREEKQYEESTA